MKPIRPETPARSRPRPGRLAGAVTRAGVAAATVHELYRTLVEGGRWWLVPMLAVLAVAAILLVGVAAVEYVAPFVYTVF